MGVHTTPRVLHTVFAQALGFVAAVAAVAAHAAPAARASKRPRVWSYGILGTATVAIFQVHDGTRLGNTIYASHALAHG